MSQLKTHARRPTDETPGPLCSAKTANPQFSDKPTCLRCRVILEREAQALERFFKGFDAAVRGFNSAVDHASASTQQFREAFAQRRPFATVNGPRINPRNRHNHVHTGVEA